MCKLCNSRRPARIHFSSITERSVLKTRLQPATVDHIIIIREYTGESPCNTCRIALVNYARTAVKFDLDKWIVQRLYLAHADKALKIQHTAKTKRNLERKFKRDNPITRIHIESHIHHNVEYGSYTTGFNGYGRKFSKSFKTLEEAQQFKQEVLNGNYTNTAK